jgi:BON domain
MKNQSILKIALTAFSLMLILSLSSFAQKTDCSNTTDDQIVASIYAKFMPKYDNQLGHVNVRIKDGVVTLEGWVTTKSAKKDMEKWAKSIKCVKSVVNKLGIGVGGGCGPGEKPCGTICIPEEEKCNIRTKSD